MAKGQIVYNLITQVYEPKDCRNDWEAFFYISNHILRFKLNSERYSEGFINRSADVVNLYRRGITSKNDLISSMQERENNNVLGVIFLNWFQRILEVNSVSEAVDVCEIIVVASALL